MNLLYVILILGDNMSEFEFKKASYGNFYNFLRSQNTNEFGICGLSQSSANYLYNTSRTGENVEEYNRVKQWVIQKYNISEDLFIKIMRGLNSSGACSYSVLTGVIFDQFKNDPEEFESKFGFPMFVNLESGRVLNEAQLMVDLYIFANHSKSGGKLFSYNENGETVISNPNLGTFDANKQTYLFGFNGSSYYDETSAISIIDSYLASYNIGELEQTEIATNLDGFKKVDMSAKDFDVISSTIEESLEKNESVLMMLSYDSIRYISEIDYGNGYIESETETKRDGAHIVNVIGTEDNSLVITTDAKICLVPIEDIINSGFVISRAKIHSKEEITR